MLVWGVDVCVGVHELGAKVNLPGARLVDGRMGGRARVRNLHACVRALPALSAHAHMNVMPCLW